MNYRCDETWHRLLAWTNGPAPSERLSAQVLLHEGFHGLDPSHPLGGKDGGKDAVCYKEGLKWIMACYFPRGEQSFTTIRTKFLDDFKGVAKNEAEAFAFVTNQDLRLGEREKLTEAASSKRVDIFHLERIATILDKPQMWQVRRQFLKIEPDTNSSVLFKRTLTALNIMWATWVEFCHQAPSILVFLDIVSYEEEKTLNQNTQFCAGLKTIRRDIVDWIKITNAVEKERPLLGEPLWNFFFAVRRVIGRIVTVLEMEGSNRVMRPWREDRGVQDFLQAVFSAPEIEEIFSAPYGTYSRLKDGLDKKLLAKMAETRNVIQFGTAREL